MKSKNLGITGALIMLLGIFSPVLSYSDSGGSSLFDLDLSNMPLFALLIGGCAITAIILAFVEKFRDLMYPGILSLLAVLYVTYYSFSNVNAYNSAREDANQAALTAGFPTDDIPASLSWGLVPLIIGALMILAGYWFSKESDDEPNLDG